MTRVLILSASFGEGHNQAAHAVEEALFGAGCDVRVVDFLDWMPPFVRSFAQFFLKQTVMRAPSLYRWFYERSATLDPSSWFYRVVNGLGFQKMQECLNTYMPDAIISTFPTPSGVISEMRRKGVPTPPVYTVVTDYTAHRQWAQPFTERYFVATEAVQRELFQYGVPAERIEVSGIPLRRPFAPDHASTLHRDRQRLREGRGLSSDRPVVLMMGGGSGLLGDVRKWKQYIWQTDLQFVVICGRNENLFRRLRPLQNERVRVLGYSTEMEIWMALSDVIVTKPGAITVSECLAMGLPMLLFRPLPMQEEQNGAYALSTGAAVAARDVKTAIHFLESIKEHPGLLASMHRAARAQPRVTAAEQIAMAIVGRGTARQVEERPCLEG